jgi:mannosyltransferase
VLDADNPIGLRSPDARLTTPEPPQRHDDLPAARAVTDRLVAAGIAAATGAGLVLRAVAPEGLWLDEAQAVAIARLPLGEIVGALREDGAPPLYYLVLHGWMAAFGTGDVAVRALSTVLAVAAVPLAWIAGRDLGGRRTAVAATLLVATSPFAIRYATEARMYSMVVTLVLAGIVLVQRERRQPGPRWNVVGLALVSGALLLTHYWSAFVVLAAVVVLLVDGGRARRGSRRAAVALALGGLALLPWVPSLLTQLRRTGAPWGRPPGPEVAELVVEGFGGTRPWGSLLAVLLVLLCGLALARVLGAGAGPADGDGASAGAGLLAVAALTLVLGAGALQVSGEGFAPRHAAVAFAPLALGVATAADALRRSPRRVLFGSVAVLGVVASVVSARTPRTQAEPIAAALESRLRPGDLVVLCPDQLAPALHRALPSLSATSTALVPPGSTLERVDWTDYPDRIRSVRPKALAGRLDAEAGDGTIWFVTSPVYTQIGQRCISVRQELARLRPEMRAVVTRRPSVFENAGLWRAPTASVEDP